MKPGPTSRPQTWISQQKTIFPEVFEHAGPLVVDILPKMATMTSGHYAETVPEEAATKRGNCSNIVNP